MIFVKKIFHSVQPHFNTMLWVYNKVILKFIAMFILNSLYLLNKNLSIVSFCCKRMTYSQPIKGCPLPQDFFFNRTDLYLMLITLAFFKQRGNTFTNRSRISHICFITGRSRSLFHGLHRSCHKWYVEFGYQIGVSVY